MSAIGQAASVLLARQPGSAEVLLVRRAIGLRFMGGFHAFPGGRVHTSDAALAAAAGLITQHVAAVRELFEETGVLLARDAAGAFPRPDPRLDQLRRALLDEQVSFDAILAERELHLYRADLRPVGSLVTPAFSPMRYDTAFFVVDLPPGQQAEVWPGELEGGLWLSAAAALQAWDQGDVHLSPPTVALLQAVAGHPVEELPPRIRPLLTRLEGGAIHPIWFSPGVQMIPLRSESLPPSTHTNAYLVGTGPRYLLDPGSPDPQEQQRLFDLLDTGSNGQRPLDAVVLTHHHRDHVGAAAAVARRYGVPVLGHALAAQALAGRVAVEGTLREGSRLDLGLAPHGRGPWQLTALHTPGHSPDHLVFHEPSYGLLFAGDLVSTLTSILIAPPEGDLAVYLESLRRLRALPSRLLLPAHGSPSARPAFVLDECLAHRRQREEQLLAALTPEPRTIPELARVIYQGSLANASGFLLAELQTLAGLQKLQREGRAQLAESGWTRIDGAKGERGGDE